MKSFQANGVPELMFGRGVSEQLAQCALNYGSRVLIVGDAFLKGHPSLLKDVSNSLSVAGISIQHVSATGKQTVEASREILGNTDLGDIDCVISMGGGRAIDVGKLVSKGLPHIAVPTTAGTGAAMNGVIFGGESAFQEANHSEQLPTLVLGDPSFIDEMDRDDFAARGIGLLMLLIEAYTAPKASVLSDALVWSGLEAFTKGFVAGVEGQVDGRDDVFFSSLMAGVGAGQAGFGLTHRLGAAIEQMTDLSYAQSCATICAEITDLQVQTLAERHPDSPAMDKYAMIGELLAERPFEDREEAYASLVGTLRRWVARLELPKIPLNSNELEKMNNEVIEGWDEDVLPARLLAEDILEALLRRSA
jgi:alcohol dehydrogenase class IV